jgi:hypothetical protein
VSARPDLAAPRLLGGRAAPLFAAALVALVPPAASACPICFGDPTSPSVHAARLGVMVLLAIIVSVLTGIALVARSWARRAAALERQAR